MVDTHCHLFLEDYPDIDDVINRMGNNINKKARITAGKSIRYAVAVDFTR